MKRICVICGLLTVLLFVACDTYKNTTTVAASPSMSSTTPPKSILKDGDTNGKLTPLNSENKVLPAKGKMPLFESPVPLRDTSSKY